jgi:hypothetical protein
VVVPVPVNLVSSLSAPTPLSYHLYEIVPALSGVAVVANVTVAIPDKVTDAPLVVASPTGFVLKDRIGPLRSKSV